MIRRAYSILRTRGPRGLWRAAKETLVPSSRLAFRNGRARFRGKVGLEIGGPSANFGPRGFLPVYAVASCIDNCNFGHDTTWEGEVREGATFRFSSRKPPGRQYVAEATDLGRIADESYDFLLSSHAIEHSANPLRALFEWTRVVKPGGLLAIIIPHKDGTFDHRRPVTPLAHLIEDLESDVGEDDLTHLGEILALHDLTLDPGGGDLAAFEARSRRNLENRCLHQHVFDTASAVAMIDHAGLEIEFVQTLTPHDIVVIARRPSSSPAVQRRDVAGLLAAARRNSPFASDHHGKPAVQ